jgi:hypothetical protein
MRLKQTQPLLRGLGIDDRCCDRTDEKKKAFLVVLAPKFLIVQVLVFSPGKAFLKKKEITCFRYESFPG